MAPKSVRPAFRLFRLRSDVIITVILWNTILCYNDKQWYKPEAVCSWWKLELKHTLVCVCVCETVGAGWRAGAIAQSGGHHRVQYRLLGWRLPAVGRDGRRAVSSNTVSPDRTFKSLNESHPNFILFCCIVLGVVSKCHILSSLASGVLGKIANASCQDTN